MDVESSNSTQLFRWGMATGIQAAPVPTSTSTTLPMGIRLHSGGWRFFLAENDGELLLFEDETKECDSSDPSLQQATEGCTQGRVVELPGGERVLATAAGWMRWFVATPSHVYSASVSAAQPTHGPKTRTRLGPLPPPKFTPDTASAQDAAATGGMPGNPLTKERSTEVVSVAKLEAFGVAARVRCLAAGEHHAVMVLTSGSAYAWGRGDYGQLGSGGVHPRCEPAPMQFASCGAGGCAVPGVRGAACGALHTLLEGDDDALYCCGWGLYGQCGTGGTEDVLTLTPVIGSRGLGCRHVAAGLAHSACVTLQGDVYTWGWNHCGQLGTGGGSLAMVPQLVQAEALDGCVRIVSCGARHTAVVTNNGDVWTWGWNRYGQLGVGDCNDRFEPTKVDLPEYFKALEVVCGWWHTCALIKADCVSNGDTICGN